MFYCEEFSSLLATKLNKLLKTQISDKAIRFVLCLFDDDEV
jgi:hypothetical protein